MMWTLIVAGLLSAGPAFAQAGTLTVAAAPSAAPDRYVIQPGDTLWDISQAFMGDAYYWPRLWSINDYITNPHWIYPGNVIVFRPGTLLDPPSMELEGRPDNGYIVQSLTFDAIAPECGPDVRFDDEIPTARYTAPGLLAKEDELDLLGEVYAAKTGMISLGERDILYLDLDDPELVECGDVLSVLRRGQEVRHPEARSVRYGHLHEVVAEVVVVHREDDIVVAQIRTSYKEVRRGDTVAPSFPVHAEMPVEAPRGDLSGTVIARLGVDEYHLASVGETVFIDRGRADGLRVGNSFYVVQRRDGVLSPTSDDPRIAAQVVGRVLVVRVSEDTSVGVVVDATDPIEVGAVLAMSIDGDASSRAP